MWIYNKVSITFYLSQKPFLLVARSIYHFKIIDNYKNNWNFAGHKLLLLYYGTRGCSKLIQNLDTDF